MENYAEKVLLIFRGDEVIEDILKLKTIFENADLEVTAATIGLNIENVKDNVYNDDSIADMFLIDVRDVKVRDYDVFVFVGRGYPASFCEKLQSLIEEVR